jgi:hypothetical protein
VHGLWEEGSRGEALMSRLMGRRNIVTGKGEEEHGIFFIFNPFLINILILIKK